MVSNLFYQYNCVGAHSLLPACESEPLSSGGLYGYFVGAYFEEWCQRLLHLWYMWINLGLFGTDGGIYIAHAESLFAQQRYRVFQQYLAVDSLVPIIRRWKMITDVAQIGGPEQRIAYGVNQHVGIAVTVKAVCVTD